MKKILFIRTDWNANDYRRENDAYGGVGYYRVILPSRYLDGYTVHVMGRELIDTKESAAQLWDRIFKKYDLVITKHVDDPPTISNMIAASRYHGTPLVLDMDDGLLLVREDNPAYEVYRKDSPEQKRYSIQASFGLVDGIITTNDFLADHMRQFNKNVHVFPNYNDVNDWQFQSIERRHDKVTVGYAGSITHDADLKLVLPVMNKLLKKYPNLVFEVLGAMPREKLKEFMSNFHGIGDEQVVVRFGTPSWKGYPNLMSDMPWDVGIAPLVDDDFNKCKSHIKWMEYAMYNIPTVASRVGPYAEYIAPDTGVLVENTEEAWTSALEQMIQDKEFRIGLGESARKHVVEHLQVKDHIGKYQEIVDFYINNYEVPSIESYMTHATQ